MSTWALVPIKEPNASKTRLAGELSWVYRHALVDALLRHVVGALKLAGNVDHIAIVGPEPRCVQSDVRFIQRKREGLNEDLRFALSEIARHGATRALIVPADLPTLETDDIQALLAYSRDSAVVIAGDRTQRGTNALALTLPSRLTLQFGENSFIQHLAQCESRGIEHRVIHRAGFAFDVDTPADLRELAQNRRFGSQHIECMHQVTRCIATRDQQNRRPASTEDLSLDR